MDLNNISIEELKNSLLGTIFADGYISSLRTSGSKNGTNASFEVTHTSKNLDYLKLKKSLFEKIDGMKCTITEHNKKTEEKTYLLYRLYVNVHE